MNCTLEMPNNDAEALLRFIKELDTATLCDGDPYERSRLLGALEAVTEAIEEGLKQDA